MPNAERKEKILLLRKSVGFLHKEVNPCWKWQIFCRSLQTNGPVVFVRKRDFLGISGVIYARQMLPMFAAVSMSRQSSEIKFPARSDGESQAACLCTARVTGDHPKSCPIALFCAFVRESYLSEFHVWHPNLLSLECGELLCPCVCSYISLKHNFPQEQHVRKMYKLIRKTIRQSPESLPTILQDLGEPEYNNRLSFQTCESEESCLQCFLLLSSRKRDLKSNVYHSSHVSKLPSFQKRRFSIVWVLLTFELFGTAFLSLAQETWFFLIWFFSFLQLSLFFFHRELSQLQMDFIFLALVFAPKKGSI